MVGMFINVVPVRVRLSGSARLGDWLRGLQECFSQARAHEHVPLAHIQSWHGAPLFDCVLVYENYPIDPSLLSLPNGLVASELATVERSDRAVVLMAVPEQRLRLRLTFDRARIGRDAARAMLTRLLRMLERFADGAEATLDAFFTAEAAQSHAPMIDRFNEAL
jgi:non-ribosomal peptide synthetase component F